MHNRVHGFTLLQLLLVIALFVIVFALVRAGISSIAASRDSLNVPIFSVAFSPDGKTLASAHEFGTDLWDVASGELKTTLWPQSRFRSVAFSPDGKTLASATGSWDGDGTVKLWNVATGEERFTLNGSFCVAFSPDGKVLASADRNVDSANRDSGGYGGYA